MSGPAVVQSTANLRDGLLSRRDELRRERGASVLDGTTFQPAPLKNVEDALEGLADAEAEGFRRESAGRASALAVFRKGIGDRVAADNDARMVALAAAMASAQSMVGHMAEFREISASILIQSRGLGGGLADQLSPTEIDRRLGRCLGAVLLPIRSLPGRFGEIEFREHYQVYDNWSDAERRESGPEIAHILITAKEDPSHE